MNVKMTLVHSLSNFRVPLLLPILSITLDINCLDTSFNVCHGWNLWKEGGLVTLSWHPIHLQLYGPYRWDEINLQVVLYQNCSLGPDQIFTYTYTDPSHAHSMSQYVMLCHNRKDLHVSVLTSWPSITCCLHAPCHLSHHSCRCCRGWPMDTMPQCCSGCQVRGCRVWRKVSPWPSAAAPASALLLTCRVRSAETEETPAPALNRPKCPCWPGGDIRKKFSSSKKYFHTETRIIRITVN